MFCDLGAGLTVHERELFAASQHCLDFKFSLDHELSANKKFCDLCYCYVCDIPAKDCKSWDNEGQRFQNHCNAHDTNSYAQYWKGCREASAKQRNGDRNALTRGEGPFDPNDAVAQQDPNLTRCRRCKWYNRFFHRNYRYFKRLHPVGFLDWCHKCGRVASENDFGKVQAERFEPQAGDIFLGTKEVSFRVLPHDPRDIERYEDSWLEADEHSPEWQYDEGEMRQDFFRHRLGERPTLDMILASVSVQDQLPNDGSFAVTENPSQYLAESSAEEMEYNRRIGCSRFSYWQKLPPDDQGKPSVSESEGIHLTRERDLVLFQQIALFEEEGFCKRIPPTERSEGKKSKLSYSITAKFDRKSMTGVSVRQAAALQGCRY